MPIDRDMNTKNHTNLNLDRVVVEIFMMDSLDI